MRSYTQAGRQNIFDHCVFFLFIFHLFCIAAFTVRRRMYSFFVFILTERALYANWAEQCASKSNLREEITEICVSIIALIPFYSLFWLTQIKLNASAQFRIYETILWHLPLTNSIAVSFSLIWICKLFILCKQVYTESIQCYAML